MAGKTIRGFVGHYPGYYRGTAGAIAFDIQHGISSAMYFVDFSVQSHGNWRHKTIYESEINQPAIIHDEKGSTLHIKVYGIDQYSADFDLGAEFDHVEFKGFIFKRKHVKRIYDDQIQLLEEYAKNATIRR
jgi:hypothetical protein